MKLTIKEVKRILKDHRYKSVVQKGECLIFVKVWFKDTRTKFEMIKEFIPYLYDFSVLDDRVILYLNKEVEE